MRLWKKLKMKQNNHNVVLVPNKIGMREYFFYSYLSIFFGILLLGCKFSSIVKIIGNINSFTLFLIGICLICFGIFKFVETILLIKTTKYTLNETRLIIETGIFSRRIAQTELWKIIDVEFKQNFVELILNCAKLQLITKDVSDPIILIKGIDFITCKESFDILCSLTNKLSQNNSIIIN